jgi:hypothetical protein
VPSDDHCAECGRLRLVAGARALASARRTRGSLGALDVTALQADADADHTDLDALRADGTDRFVAKAKQRRRPRDVAIFLILRDTGCAPNRWPGSRCSLSTRAVACAACGVKGGKT